MLQFSPKLSSRPPAVASLPASPSLPVIIQIFASKLSSPYSLLYPQFQTQQELPRHLSPLSRQTSVPPRTISPSHPQNCIRPKLQLLLIVCPSSQLTEQILVEDPAFLIPVDAFSLHFLAQSHS